jgi:hypothetical protein
MRALAIVSVAAVLLAFAAPARAASAGETASDESLVAEKLSALALGVLDGMFGPGRAQVLVSVRGERLQITSETEVLTPIGRAPQSPAQIKEALRLLDLPGYHKERRTEKEPARATPASPAPQAYQKDFEHSLRDAGFEIKKIEATVILDAALTDSEVREAAQLLPQVLRIDAERGDALSLMRAPMRPAWKGAFSTPGDWRKLTFAAAGLAAALVVVAILAGGLVRGARVFAKEVAGRRAQAAPSLDDSGEPLPELMPGSPSGLTGAGAAPLPALGRRFDFLETADASEAARSLAEEAPGDLAQVFAHLAKAAPETASRLFSKLPADVQADASAAILKLKSVDQDRLAAIEERLKDLIENGLRGSERLATILSRVPDDERATLLGRLAAGEDPGGAAETERLLYSKDPGEAP